MTCLQHAHLLTLTLTVDFYRWLNDAIVVGTGEQTASGPIYTFHTIG